MKRNAVLLILAATFSFATAAKADNITLLGFTGFDYVQANPNPGGMAPGFLQTGDEYHAVGFVTSFHSMLSGVVTPATDEYTFYLTDATVTASSYVDDVLEVVFANNATLTVYEDSRSSGTAASYGINPPNPTAPPTFIDGVNALQADVDNFALIYDYNTAQGNFQGTASLVAGSKLFAVPVAQRSGWVLGGLAGAPNASVPTGYVNQINGEIQIPGATSATQKTWGSLKALYR